MKVITTNRFKGIAIEEMASGDTFMLDSAPCIKTVEYEHSSNRILCVGLVDGNIFYLSPGRRVEPLPLRATEEP